MTVYTFVCTRCFAGWNMASTIEPARPPCRWCGLRDKVEFRGSYEKVNLR